MVHTASGCIAKFTIFIYPLYQNEANKPGYIQLHFFDSAEAIRKRLENQPSHECTAKEIQRLDKIWRQFKPFAELHKRMSHISYVIVRP
jgi:hypothetical protein